MVRVVFVHPDLGIGGAERLVVDSALALKSRGSHDVQFITAHHDPSHCFQETKDGTLKVTAAGDWLPRHLFGRFCAFWAYIRMIYISVYLVFFSGIQVDVIICDQVSACVPALKLSKAKVLFYCHFPDLLLTQRKSFLKKLYRLPLDWLEEMTTGMADVILVNSNFTRETFASTFTSLKSKQPAVLHPSINFKGFDVTVPAKEHENLVPPTAKVIFLSINRYERKKNLKLALESMDWLKNKVSKTEWSGIHLVVAGGYDDRVQENKDYYLELRSLAEKYKLQDNVTFLQSFSDTQKVALLQLCNCLLYTPSHEHFGIVPIEAMYMRRPVIAVGSGGPLETVLHNETGFLCSPDAESFSVAMKKFVDDSTLTTKFGTAGRNHVLGKFSFDVFAEKLHNIVVDDSPVSNMWRVGVQCALWVTVFGAAATWVLLKDL